MPRYTARGRAMAIDQYLALPPKARAQVDIRLEELLHHPEGPSLRVRPAERPMDHPLRRRRAGLILYAVGHEHQSVLIHRLV